MKVGAFLLTVRHRVLALMSVPDWLSPGHCKQNNIRRSRISMLPLNEELLDWYRNGASGTPPDLPDEPDAPRLNSHLPTQGEASAAMRLANKLRNEMKSLLPVPDTPLRFLVLPREVHDSIYEYATVPESTLRFNAIPAVIDDKPYDRRDFFRHFSPVFTNDVAYSISLKSLIRLLTINKKVHGEVEKLFWSKVKVTIRVERRSRQVPADSFGPIPVRLQPSKSCAWRHPAAEYTTL